MITSPVVGSLSPEIISISVLFPDPLFPLIKVDEFFSIFKLKSLIIYLSLSSNLKLIFFYCKNFSNLKFLIDF